MIYEVFAHDGRQWLRCGGYDTKDVADSEARKLAEGTPYGYNAEVRIEPDAPVYGGACVSVFHAVDPPPFPRTR